MDNLISIIVPVYNTEKYLDECILSIISQTHKNWELILVDDGSTDRSGQICDSYALKDSRIRVIHQKNGGPSAARNTALNATRGTFVGFVDSDDTIDKKTFETAFAAITENNTDWVMWDTKTPNKFAKEGRIEGKEYQQLKLDSIILRGVGPAVWLQMFRTNIIKDNNIKFQFRRHEDYLFIIKYLLHSSNIYYLKNCYFYYYRPLETSLGSSYHENWPLLTDKIIASLQDALKPYTDLPYKKYLNARILQFAYSVIFMEARSRNHKPFKEKITIIKEYLSRPAAKELFKDNAVKLLNKKTRLVLFLANAGYYKTAYFTTKCIFILFNIKRKIPYKVRRYLK